MKKIDLISMSVRNLWRRKLRTALTILGVVIGACSIILMLSLGLAMEKNMEEQFAQMGDLTLIQVWSYGGGNSTQEIDDKVLKEFEKVDHVVRAIPMLNDINVYLSSGKYRTPDPYWEIYVMDAADIEALGYKVEEGRSLLPEETRSILMGKNVLQYFTKRGKQIDYSKELEFMPFDLEKDKVTLEVIQYDWETGKPQLEDVNGNKIKAPKGTEVNVVGLFPETSMDLARKVIIPRALYEELKKEQIAYKKAMGWYTDEEAKRDKKRTYNEVMIKVDHQDNVVSTLEQIKSMGYDAYNNMEWLEQYKQEAAAKRMALGGIGIVSFVVAAIGIANTMMMSIYERTKEIGVMKVIGAKLVDIKYLFLMEALFIGLIGGILGASISVGISLILNAIGEPIARMLGMWGGTTVSLVPPWLIAAGIIFSTLVGLVSGYFPARKAMKLSALSAIRTE